MAPLQIRDDFIKTGTKARPGDRHDKKWIVIHETGNAKPGSDAQSHAAYIKDLALQNELYLSWHYTVDDHAVYRHIPDDEIAWHAGDGRKDDGGNLAGIGVEICVNPECNYEKALRNAAQLTAQLMRAHGIPIENVRQHHDFSGRDCPERMRREGRWKDFLAMCQSGKPSSIEKHTVHAQQRTFAAGDAVRLSGALYADSQGAVQIEHGIRERECTVTMCADKRRAAPYRIDGRGWARAADLTLVKPAGIVQKSSKALQNGVWVQVKNASLYISSHGGRAVNRIEGVFQVQSYLPDRDAGVLLAKNLGWVCEEDVAVVERHAAL